MKRIFLVVAMVLPMWCFGQNMDSLSMPVLDGKVGFQKVVTMEEKIKYNYVADWFSVAMMAVAGIVVVVILTTVSWRLEKFGRLL